jgi:hypothetical protein
LLRRTERDRPLVGDDLDRTEDVKLHLRTTP